MAFILGDNQKVHVAVGFQDSAGNTAQVKGVPVWTSSDATVLTVVADADGLGAWVTAVGLLGSGQAQMTADADVDGTTVVPINGVFDVSVVASQALTALINPGTPEPK